ncbi:MAG: hypothetical protein HY332_01995 [Chloroflexi bacterium]|nr:hypothetical protein [Chloroflexota bacterium]
MSRFSTGRHVLDEPTEPEPASRSGAAPCATLETLDRGAATRATAPAPRTPAPSPALCQLLNVAALDETFREQFLASPVRAAVQAGLAPHVAFGCGLPDPELRLPAIRLTEDDWAILRSLPPVRTLADAGRHVFRSG